MLKTLAALLAILLAAPALAQSPDDPEAPSRAPTLDQLAGVWAYDFSHLATRPDIASIAESGRLRHILDFQGRVTWEFTGQTLHVRGGSTQTYELSPAAQGPRLFTNIDAPRNAVPVSLKLIDDDTLLAGFTEFDEHPAFRFTRLTRPGSDAVGRWSSEDESVRLIITGAKRVILTGLGERLIGAASIEADAGEHRLTLPNNERLVLDIAGDLASAELTREGEDPVTVRRSFDPMEWIEGGWIVEPGPTRDLPFYSIWPEAFGAPAPPLEPQQAFFVRDGLHFGQLPLKPHSVNGDTVIFQVNEGDQASLLPFKRRDEHHLETLVVKLVLRASDAPDHAHDHAGHNHGPGDGHDH